MRKCRGSRPPAILRVRCSVGDSVVRCETCKREEQVAFAYCLRKGWPKCCGHTMTLISNPSRETVSAAVDQIMAPVAAIKKVMR